jgi:ubiquinone/menaquinone biosynthesis C-methylase UbiE
LPAQNDLFEYYSARAPEYDEIYSGGIPASVGDPKIYEEETETISKLLPGHIGGECIDIACGTGFWLPFYQGSCTEITLIDQSRSMLAECARKIEKLGIAGKTEIIAGDFFGYPFPPDRYDSALVGFLLSHLTEAEEKEFFTILKRLLRPRGRFVIVDSSWSQDRASTRPKAGFHRRKLQNGREFTIFKRYFAEEDLSALAAKHRLNLDMLYFGRVFLAAAGNMLGG